MDRLASVPRLGTARSRDACYSIHQGISDLIATDQRLALSVSTQEGSAETRPILHRQEIRLHIRDSHGFVPRTWEISAEMTELEPGTEIRNTRMEIRPR